MLVAIERFPGPALVMCVDVREHRRFIGRYPGHRLVHAERIEDALLEKLAELHAGPLLDQVTLHVNRDTVMPPCARLVQERDSGQLVDKVLQGLAVADHVRVEVLLVDGRVAENAVGESGGMLQ